MEESHNLRLSAESVLVQNGDRKWKVNMFYQSANMLHHSEDEWAVNKEVEKLSKGC